MKDKLVIHAGNSGDVSVGIEPLSVKITIEGNTDIEDTLDNIEYKDNKKRFIEDIKKLMRWFDDIPSEVREIATE